VVGTTANILTLIGRKISGFATRTAGRVDWNHGAMAEFAKVYVRRFRRHGKKASLHLARFQTSLNGFPMPVWVSVSPSILIVNLKVCLMSSLVLSLAYSTVSAYSSPLRV